MGCGVIVRFEVGRGEVWGLSKLSPEFGTAIAVPAKTPRKRLARSGRVYGGVK